MKKFFLLLIFFVVTYAYQVSVSILPQKFVVDFIGGNKIDVNVMVPKGASPAIYSPKTQQLLNLKKSLIYFKIGVPFEKAWLSKFRAVNPKMKIVDFGENLIKNSNPHIWLDPIFLISEAEVVYKNLSKIDPKNRDFYLSNFEKFKKLSLKIDKKIKTILNSLKNRKFIIFHPNLYYFAKRYNLTEIALEKEGKEPSFRYLIKIIKIAKENNIKVVFTAPEFSKKSAQFLATKIGAKVVDFSALEYDIFKNLIKVSKILNDIKN